MQTTPRPDPMALFLSRLDEARDLIARIDHYVENHMERDPETISWGAAGDAGRLVSMLQEITTTFGL